MPIFTIIFKYAIITVNNIYNNMLEKIVENFNLDEKEAKVYLASLSMGRSKVSEIAKEAQLNRITAYEILKRLSQKGIANKTVIKDMIYFQVVEPKLLINKMERQTEIAREILPQLNLLVGAKKGRPKVNYYEGIEGMKTVYEDTLLCEDKAIYDITNGEKLFNCFGKDFMDNYIKKRVRKKIKIKVLVSDNPSSRQIVKNSKQVLREYKFFDEKNYPIPNEIMIYDNKIILLSFTSKIGVLIEDDEISQSIKIMWNMVWNKS